MTLVLAVVLAADAFYSQRVTSGGIAVLGHASVTREGLESARAHLDAVLKDAPKLRRNLEARGYELHVMGLRQFPSDLPEYRALRGTRLHTGQLFDWHMVGGHISESSGYFSSCTEGTLLPIVGHRLYGDDTCFHELGHVIDWFALDAAGRARSVKQFNASKELWKGEYAATNAHEWFGEVTKYWFRQDRDDLGFYNEHSGQGRKWLCNHDPEGCRFAEEVYGGKLDPGSPKTIALSAGPATDEGKLRSLESVTPVRVVVRNATKQRVHVVWIDYSGKRASGREHVIEPGAENAEFSWKTHPFVVTNDAGEAIATFVVPDEDALVVVDAPARKK